jgi:hypothetical protein
LRTVQRLARRIKELGYGRPGGRWHVTWPSSPRCATPTDHAQLRRHPAARTKEALQQRRYINVGIELRPMQTEPCRTDLNLGQLPSCAAGQSFDQ